MNRYEIYEYIQGTFHATGIWRRGYHMSEIERDLNKEIKKLKKPCVIVISAMPVLDP